MQGTEQSYKKVKPWLWLGIFCMPLIFSWLTFRRGYSPKVRFIAVIMLAYVFTLIILFPPISFSAEKTDVWVWHTEDLKYMYDIKQTNEEHPCGDVAEISLSTFPSVDGASELGMEIILEYSGEEIINRWVVPIDYYVIGISEDKLFIPHNSKGALKISTDGSFTIQPEPEYNRELVQSCPQAVMEEYPNSGYLRCHKYEDLKTKKIRFIAYEGPCT